MIRSSGVGSGTDTPRHLHHRGPRNSLFLKGQAAESDVHVDAGWLMAKEQNPGLLRECQGVGLPRQEAELAAGVHKGRPALLGQQDQCIDVARHSRPSQQRYGKAANDKPGHVLRLPPLDQIG